jgi:hypothetical protein
VRTVSLPAFTPNVTVAPTPNSLRSYLALSKPSLPSGARKPPVYFMLDTLSSVRVNRPGDASLLPLLSPLWRRVVPKAPGSLRPSPWLWSAIEDIVGAVRRKVVGERGFAMPAQRVPFGDDLLAIHEPTRIESFTERTEGMAHTIPDSPGFRGKILSG